MHAGPRSASIIGLFVALMAAALAFSAPAALAAGVQRAIAVQDLHTDRLLDRRGVVGTGIGRDDGGAEVIVFTRRGQIAVPDRLNRVPVDVEVTGPITALGSRPKGKSGKIDPRSRFARPVPIGVSTGNAGECSAGTIGARVKSSSGQVFALSNNHVYALENDAPIGSKVLQPGLYDTGCTFSSQNVFGTLSAFAPITFSTSASNVVDAAIASTTTANLGNGTPSNGYGVPSSTTRNPAVDLAVQKYGRTTSLTKGRIVAINVTLNIGYSSGTARFVNQVVAYSRRRALLKAGDSGSLMVTNNTEARPVGLLFAGDASGKYGIANPIGAVLSQFGVTVDGK